MTPLVAIIMIGIAIYSLVVLRIVIKEGLEVTKEEKEDKNESS